MQDRTKEVQQFFENRVYAFSEDRSGAFDVWAFRVGDFTYEEVRRFCTAYDTSSVKFEAGHEDAVYPHAPSTYVEVTVQVAHCYRKD